MDARMMSSDVVGYVPAVWETSSLSFFLTFITTEPSSPTTATRKKPTTCKCFMPVNLFVFFSTRYSLFSALTN